MCNLDSDYERMLYVLRSQNRGWYECGEWNEVVFTEGALEDGYRMIRVSSHDISFIFDVTGRFVDIVNYSNG